MNNTVGSSGKTVTCDLDSVYSFFNHSCEYPTMMRTGGDDSAKHELYAARNIKKGEEVSVVYIEPYAPKAFRQQQLAPWLAGPCACKRCKSER